MESIPLNNAAIGVYKSGNQSGNEASRRTFDEVHAAIAGDNLAEITDTYRRLLQDKGKREARGFKAAKFPGVTLSGVINGKRAGGAPIHHTGVFQFDFDKAESPEDAAELRDIIADNPFVVEAFVSPSYGVKAFLRGQPAKDADDHARQWEHANRTLCEAIGVEFNDKDVDKNVKSLVGLTFLCHDADAYYNPNAIALEPAPAPEPEPERKPAATDAGRRAKQARRYLKDIPVLSDREEWFKIAAAAYNCGLSIDEIEQWASDGDKYQPGEIAALGLDKPGPKRKAGLKTLKDYAEAFGGNVARADIAREMGFIPGAGEAAKPVAGSVHNARVAMSIMGIAGDFALNEWDGKIYLRDNQYNERKDLPVIRDAIEKHFAGELDYVPTRESLADGITAEARANAYNSVTDALNALEWDGVDRLSDLGEKVYGAGGELNSAIAALIPRGMVVRALHPGAHFPYCPVLVSDHQGAGKGTSLKALCPGGRGCYAEGVQFSGFDYQKKLQERGRGKNLLEVGEIDAIGGAALSNLKAFVTDEILTNREAYAAEASDMPVTFILVGTTNNQHFLTDSQNRRVPVITIPKDVFVDTEYLYANRQQIWAQCVDEYRQGKWFVDKDGRDLPAGVAEVRMDESLWNAAEQQSQQHELENPLFVWLGEALEHLDRIPHPDYSDVILSAVLQDALGFGIGDKDETTLHPYTGRIIPAELSRQMGRYGFTSATTRLPNFGNKRCWRKV